MLPKDYFKTYEELESRATPGPWASNYRQRPGYGRLVFWKRTPYSEVIFDNIDDIKFIAFLRDFVPMLIKENKELRKKLGDIEGDSQDIL